MNRFLGPASLGVSLLALAIALWAPRGGEAPPLRPSESPAALDAPDVEALERRVKTLEENALNLSKRLMLLEQRPGAVTEGGGAVPGSLAAEVAQLRTEVRGMVVGEAIQSEGGRQYLKDMVRSVQDEMRTEQRDLRQQRAEQYQAQAQVQRAERLSRFISEARLSYSQEQELKRRLDGEETQRQALYEAMRTGGKSSRDARQEIRQTREQTDKEVKALLDESQQAKYDEMRREEFRQSRGGGPGGGPGGGRGPGWGSDDAP